jgi:hypothetical protein
LEEKSSRLCRGSNLERPVVQPETRQTRLTELHCSIGLGTELNLLKDERFQTFIIPAAILIMRLDAQAAQICLHCVKSFKELFNKIADGIF